MSADEEAQRWALVDRVDRLVADVTRLTAERDEARQDAAWVRETMGRELVEERAGHADTLTALAAITAERDAARAEAARLREALGQIAAMPLPDAYHLAHLARTAIAPPPGEPTDG